MNNSTIFDLPKLLYVPGYKLIYSDVATQQEYPVENLRFSGKMPALIIWTSATGYPHHIPINTPTLWSKESVLVGDIGAFHLAPINPPDPPNLLTVNTED